MTGEKIFVIGIESVIIIVIEKTSRQTKVVVLGYKVVTFVENKLSGENFVVRRAMWGGRLRGESRCIQAAIATDWAPEGL